MRLSVIKYDDNETVFYNPLVFFKNEDLIIFPFKEFDDFYNETMGNLNVEKKSKIFFTSKIRDFTYC